MVNIKILSNDYYIVKHYRNYELLIALRYICANHYENMSMQYTEMFNVVKNENFQLKENCIFLIFAQNIDCGYT